MAASEEDYSGVFDRLAGFAQNRPPVPLSLDWTSLAAVSIKTGKLTDGILRHIMFWFDPEDYNKGAAKDSSHQ